MDRTPMFALVLKDTFFSIEVGAGCEDACTPSVGGSRRRAASQPSLRAEGRTRSGSREAAVPPLYVSKASSREWMRVSEEAAALELRQPPAPAAPAPAGAVQPAAPASPELPCKGRSGRSISTMSTASSDGGEVDAAPSDAAGSLAPSAKREPAKAADAEWTTVMMRNLPTTYARADLRSLLDAEGFAGRYDFLYLPADFQTAASACFAFVNLVSPEDARKFREHFARFRRWGTPSNRACNVSWANADQQGLPAIIERYRNSSVMHRSVPEECKPILLESGQEVEFPKATKKLWPPSAGFGARAKRGAR